jgi:Fe-S-cluster-containing hydrogenase component 2
MDMQKEVAICCDLCGGQPQCVDLCHSNCLKLAEGGTENRDRVINLAKVLEKRLSGEG